MKKLMVISFLTLIVMFPSATFSGDVYSVLVTANFEDSLSNRVSPQGDATITYDVGNQEWTVALNMSGLKKKHSDYLFQFSRKNQLIEYHDVPLEATDKNGNLVEEFTVTGVHGVFTESDGYAEDDYDIVRIVDPCGKSGGVKISSVDQNTVDPNLPYRNKGTILIRAREDGLGGLLKF